MKICFLCFSLSYVNLSLHLYASFNLINIIFGGTTLNGKHGNIFYYIMCICSCVIQSRTPNFCGLLYHLRIKYCIEIYVAIHDSKLPIFYNHWSLWKNIFEQYNSQLIICYTLYLFHSKSRTCKHFFFISSIYLYKFKAYYFTDVNVYMYERGLKGGKRKDFFFVKLACILNLFMKIQ